MTFLPRKSLRARDDFNTTEGSDPRSPSYQNITGGYVSLLPINERSTSYLQPWLSITRWTLNNGMSTRAIVSGSFHISGGAFVPAHALASGYQQVTPSAGGWEIYTPPILNNGSHIDGLGNTVYTSGQAYQFLLSSSGTPFSGYHNNLYPIKHPVTIELDVMSLYGAGTGMPGYLTGQASLTGLPRLTGTLNHGIYLSDGSFWDYFEIRPDGIRSINHPEIAIPMDFYTSPTKVRLGLENNNIFILTEDGRGVAGLSKFNTPTLTADKAKIAFGAPHTGYGFSFSGVDSFVGRTTWDNIKILTGSLKVVLPTGSDVLYQTGTHTLYTDVFSPSVPLSEYLYAFVGYSSYLGGTTTVTAQYSGASGFIDVFSSSITLTPGESPKALPLSFAPIYQTAANTGYAVDTSSLGNFLRFKINQQSNNGSAPAPAVDYIEVAAGTDVSLMEVVPNWKLASISTKINFGLRSGEFYRYRPGATPYTTAFYISPEVTGRVSGSFIDSSYFNLIGSVVGTGEIVSFGPYDTSFQTYSTKTLTAASGSEAVQYLGTTPQSNLFYNGDLNASYMPVDSLTGYATGFIYGEIAQGLSIRTGYSGYGVIRLEKVAVQRADTVNRAGQIPTDYAQRYLFTPTGSLLDHGSLEVVIPSGIMVGQCFASYDLKILRGSGLYFYVKNYTGLDVKNRVYLPAQYFTDYRNIRIPFDVTDTGKYYLGLSPSGATSPVEYIIDNIAITPYTPAYLKITGSPLMTHTHIGDTVSQSIAPSKSARAATIAEGSILLESYPTGSSGIFIQKLSPPNNRGFTFYINTGGYPVVELDLTDGAWLTGGLSDGGDIYALASEQYLGKRYITGESRVPLGSLSHLGFMHEVWAWKNFGTRGFSGQNFGYNFASCNRGYITINGGLVASEDMMYNWNSNTIAYTTGDLVPTTSYVTDGTGTVIIGSGLLAKIDNVGIHRYPAADVESFLTLRCAKQSMPYFVPDVMLKPHTQLQDRPTCIANKRDDQDRSMMNWSIYNFSNPTPYTNWDHGPMHNHLMFYGNVTKDGKTPYTGYSGMLGSTYFSGGYGVAKYSSSTDRLINYMGKFTTATSTKMRDYGVAIGYGDVVGWLGYFSTIVGTWIYPYSTGVFFEIAKDIRYPTGAALVMGISGGGAGNYYLYAGERTATLPLSWTGSVSIGSQISGWKHVGMDVSMLDNGGGLYVPSLALFVNGYKTQTTVPTFVVGGAFEYVGRSGSTNKSAMFFGRGITANLADTFIDYVYNGATNPGGTGIIDWSGCASPTASKGGLYQGIFINNQRYSGLLWSGVYTFPSIIFPSTTGYSDKTIWIGTNNQMDNTVPFTDGFVLADRSPFREVQGYYFAYDDQPLKMAFGATDSPIKLGYTVPPNAINIARIDSPEFTTTASITSLDLSDRNTNNLSSYRGGLYSLVASKAMVSGSEASGYYRGINLRNYFSQGDVIYTGQLDTEDIRVTSLSIVHPDLDQPQEAFFTYLVGRGEWGVHLSDYAPRATGGFLEYGTGQRQIFEDYLSNIDRVRSSITLKDSNGRVISVNDFPWDVYTSPVTPSILRGAVISGAEINVDGLGPATGHYTTDGFTFTPFAITQAALPDGVLSAVIVTAEQKAEDTIWVHYPAYRFRDGKIDRSHREILNPAPIFRKRVDYLPANAGEFSTNLDPDRHKKYWLTVYGVNSGVTGEF